jgi:ligand-binding SRPBCC domain-containing protein
MKIYTLKRQLMIKRPIDEVFRFFEKPENLSRITPDGIGFEILTPRPISMHVGAVLDYTIRVIGIPVHWTTLIADYDPPRRFADVALRSPYSLWHHTHTFEETLDGTLMTDEVRYALPFGPLGRLVHSLWVQGQLERIFDYREAAIHRLLEPSWAEPSPPR